MEKVGSILLIYENHEVPQGTLECDGRALSSQDYANLFNKIGTKYGGNGDPTFNIPTLNATPNKFVIVFEQLEVPSLPPGDTVQPTADPMRFVNMLLQNAKGFCDSLMNGFTTENMAMGITQAGKTKEVADYLKDLQFYLNTCSLYAAMGEIQRMLDAGLPPELAPFITEARLNSYKSKIQTYLGL